MVKLPDFNFVISRAFAPLDKLLNILDKKDIVGTKCIFPKGKTFKQELTETKKYWNINLSINQSITNSSSRILVLEAFERA